MKCACGCGQEIIIKLPSHKYYGIPKYILGHHRRNKSHTKESINKMCRVQKNKIISENQKKKISDFMIGKQHHTQKHSEKSKKKISESLIGKCGKNSRNWQGGKSFEPYCPKFNEKKKEEIRNQYGRKCYVCDKLESEQKKEQKERGKRQFRLSVHHTDSDKEQGCNGKVWKLVPTCIHCHNSKKMRILCV